MPTTLGEASIRQQKTLAVVPKVSSVLSLLGSTYIIYDFIKLEPSKRKMYHRLLLGMSTCDFMASSAWFFTTWPIPPDVLEIWGASGNQRTCSAQGFFAQFSIASVVYNGCLAIYYYIVIRLGWSLKHLDQSRIELFMHVIAILMGLLTSSVSVGLGLINPIGWDCWISAVPIDCKQSFNNSGKTTCIRGDNANLYQWIFFYGPLWFIIAGVTIIMSTIVHQFMEQDKKNAQYGENNLLTSSRQKKRIGNRIKYIVKSTQKKSHVRRNKTLIDMQKQSFFYVCSFYVTWLFPTILRITELTGDVVYYHWVMLSASFVPIQGFLNMIVYLRPQYRKVRHLRKIRERARNNIEEGKERVSNLGEEIEVESIEESSTMIHKKMSSGYQTVRDLKEALVNGDDGAGTEFGGIVFDDTAGMDPGSDDAIPTVIPDIIDAELCATSTQEDVHNEISKNERTLPSNSTKKVRLT